MKTRMRWIVSILLGGIFCCLFLSLVYAKGNEKILVSVIIASNEGTDFNLDNDAYRDQLIQLFSYRSYEQKNQQIVNLSKAEHKIIPLMDDYEMVLTLQGEEKERIMIQALIRKGNVQYVNTVLSIMKNGVVFIGGPTIGKNALIVALERR